MNHSQINSFVSKQKTKKSFDYFFHSSNLQDLVRKFEDVFNIFNFRIKTSVNSVFSNLTFTVNCVDV